MKQKPSAVKVVIFGEIYTKYREVPRSVFNTFKILDAFLIEFIRLHVFVCYCI